MTRQPNHHRRYRPELDPGRVATAETVLLSTSHRTSNPWLRAFADRKLRELYEQAGATWSPDPRPDLVERHGPAAAVARHVDDLLDELDQDGGLM